MPAGTTTERGEMSMKAAVVSAFDSGPRYEEFPDPATPDAPGMLVEVVAAGLHPRVRSQADGSHYTSTGELPFVPGIDGVGRGADGALRYFILPDTTLGSMAERTVIDARRSIVLPQDADPIAVAAAMNPAMSSWIALRQRVQFERGQGSVSTRDILAELPGLAQAVTNGSLDIDAKSVSLADVEPAWIEAAHTTQRIVLTPR